MASRLSILPIAYLSAYLGPGYLCDHTYGNGTRNMRICALGLPAEPTPAYVLLYGCMYIPTFSSQGHMTRGNRPALHQEGKNNQKEKAEGKPSNPRGGHSLPRKSQNEGCAGAKKKITRKKLIEE
ncbi:hypothetical protein F5Y02DRAFT_173398 [Annulohypoxylon stygium]|nr:hypothetical protein F5Y02DRAFT_173398 [Annulohypoxylon stygium]